MIDIPEWFRRKHAGEPTDEPADVHNIAHAVEDLPPHARDEGRLMLGTETGTRVQRREFDSLTDKVRDALSRGGGDLELVKVLHFLHNYPVTDYKYAVSDFLIRGSRPDETKLKALAANGCGATLNLCKETPAGDRLLIEQAGLNGQIESLHVGIIDGTPPSVAQMVEILSKLDEFQKAHLERKVYIHCEAGKGRTGVAVACYRMAVMGWDEEAALAEAQRFECSTPAQLEFIVHFGALLRGVPPHPIISPLGNVQPSPDQLAATLQSAAKQAVPA